MNYARHGPDAPGRLPRPPPASCESPRAASTWREVRCRVILIQKPTNVTKCYEILLKLYNHYNVNLSKLKCPEFDSIWLVVEVTLRDHLLTGNFVTFADCSAQTTRQRTSLPVEAARGGSQEAVGGVRVRRGRGGHNS